MHNPSDETEQYDEPETIVQRHGGVELPFKHHDGGKVGGGGRGVWDEAIQRIEPLCTLGERVRAQHRMVKVWNLQTIFGKNQSMHSPPREPHSYHARVQTRGAPRKRRRSRRIHLGSSKLCESSVAAWVAGVRNGARGRAHTTPHPITRSGKASSFACSRAAARRAPDVRQMRVSLAYSRVCSRSVDLDGAVDLEYKPPRGEEADGACGEREQR